MPSGIQLRVPEAVYSVTSTAQNLNVQQGNTLGNAQPLTPHFPRAKSNDWDKQIEIAISITIEAVAVVAAVATTAVAGPVAGAAVYGVAKAAGNNIAGRQNGWDWRQFAYDSVTYYAGSSVAGGGAASGAGSTGTITWSQATINAAAQTTINAGVDYAFYQATGGEYGQEFTWDSYLTNIATSAVTSKLSSEYSSTEFAQSLDQNWAGQIVNRLGTDAANGFVSDTIRRNTFGSYDADRETGLNFLERTLQTSASSTAKGLATRAGEYLGAIALQSNDGPEESQYQQAKSNAPKEPNWLQSTIDFLTSSEDSANVVKQTALSAQQDKREVEALAREVTDAQREAGAQAAITDLGNGNALASLDDPRVLKEIALAQASSLTEIADIKLGNKYTGTLSTDGPIREITQSDLEAEALLGGFNQRAINDALGLPNESVNPFDISFNTGVLDFPEELTIPSLDDYGLSQYQNLSFTDALGNSFDDFKEGISYIWNNPDKAAKSIVDGVVGLYDDINEYGAAGAFAVRYVESAVETAVSGIRLYDAYERGDDNYLTQTAADFTFGAGTTLLGGGATAIAGKTLVAGVKTGATRLGSLAPDLNTDFNLDADRLYQGTNSQIGLIPESAPYSGAIRYSQESVSSRTGNGQFLLNLTDDIASNGFNSDFALTAIRLPDGELTSFDNRRLLSTNAAGETPYLHIYDFDAPFPQDRFNNLDDGARVFPTSFSDIATRRTYLEGQSISTWGEATILRGYNQTDWKGANGVGFDLYGSPNTPRINASNLGDGIFDTEGARYLESLRNVGVLNGARGISHKAQSNQPLNFSGGAPSVIDNMFSPDVVNSRSSDFYELYGDNPLRGTLSNREARVWYLSQENSIPGLLDSSQPLSSQARQAFELRNQFRSDARVMMQDRITADRLFREETNLTFENLVNKTEGKLMERGISHPSEDQIFQEIINSSQRSRQSVNKRLGL